MRKGFWLASGLVFAAMWSRFLVHAPNFTPVLAVALFSGHLFKNKWSAFALPMLALLSTDVFLGFYSSMWAVYGSLALIVAMGMRLSPSRKWSAVSSVVLSSVLFFIVTNLAVWWQSGLYARSVQGLSACFLAALPFFDNTLFSTALYTAVLFSVFYLVKRWRPQWAMA